MKPVTVAIVGAGGRGMGYASFAEKYPERMKVVGVAEPREYYRDTMVRTHSIPSDNVFLDWKDMAARDRFADVVVVATQDAMHAEPAIAFANKGYHMLLEKPMAPTEEECRRIVEAVTRNKIIFAVGHVMRYTPYSRKVKEMVDAGMVGEIVNIQLVEPVGYWHQTHSYVRGNWRNEEESTFMLLAKSCHDLDWIHYLMGEKCLALSSFGALKHFRKEEKPEGAGDRCLDCGVEPNCPFSAKKIYLGRVKAGHTEWPVDVLTPEPTIESVTEALKTGPYGRCVYECDNDVVDNQVVSMLFEGRKTASFTMTAFSEHVGRKVRIFGTRGYISGDSSKIRHFDFLTDKTTEIDTKAPELSILGGHGGGDFGLMDCFIDAVANEDPSRILSGPEETLESHLMVFAAERARHENRVVEM